MTKGLKKFSFIAPPLLFTTFTVQMRPTRALKFVN